MEKGLKGQNITDVFCMFQNLSQKVAKSLKDGNFNIPDVVE